MYNIAEPIDVYILLQKDIYLLQADWLLNESYRQSL